MQHNVARRQDDETTRQQTKQDGDGMRGETRVGDGSGERGVGRGERYDSRRPKRDKRRGGAGN
jgi:hypothetical protein